MNRSNKKVKKEQPEALATKPNDKHSLSIRGSQKEQSVTRTAVKAEGMPTWVVAFVGLDLLFSSCD